MLNSFLNDSLQVHIGLFTKLILSNKGPRRLDAGGPRDALLRHWAWILPHGNAEVERAISQFSDTVTTKRSYHKRHRNPSSFLNPNRWTPANLTLNRWTPANLQMDSKLVYFALNVRASYRRWRKETEAEERQRQIKEKEELAEALKSKIALRRSKMQN